MNVQIVGDIIECKKGKTGEIISILEEIQLKYGYLPREALELVAQRTGKSLVDIFGVATFYKALRDDEGQGVLARDRQLSRRMRPGSHRRRRRPLLLQRRRQRRAGGARGDTQGRRQRGGVDGSEDLPGEGQLPALQPLAAGSRAQH
ncbi:MAG: NAD(P)H-dependent oxidoreductase subunit E [Deltaproteobacteria bacterium]|nr:NAD(P)H-dependent oxidoreductase subunit E [Deltaproteobacteria bacterium]